MMGHKQVVFIRRQHVLYKHWKVHTGRFRDNTDVQETCTLFSVEATVLVIEDQSLHDLGMCKINLFKLGEWPNKFICQKTYPLPVE